MSSRAKSRDNLSDAKVKSPRKDSNMALATASSANTVTLNIKVINAKNLKGIKGDKVSTLVRVQFADFEPKESPVIADNANPTFGFTLDQTFNLDDNLIDIFANRKLVLTLIESLPKEKTAVLATAEVSLGARFLKYPPRLDSAPSDAPLSSPELSFVETITWTYVTPKMVAGSDAPLVDIELSLSKCLVSPADWEAGNLVAFTIADMAPVPDEWTTKEGSDRDPNSNIYTYTVNLVLSGQAGEERAISFPGGILLNSDSPSAMELPIGSQPMYTTKSSSPTDGKPADEKPALEVARNPVPSKRVEWSSLVTQKYIWVNKNFMARLRERIQSRRPIELEMIRELQPKFAGVADSQSVKYKGRVNIDCTPLLFPRVIGFKGRYAVEGDDRDRRLSVVEGKPSMGSDTSLHQKEGKSKLTKEGSDVYKTLGTSLGVEILLGKPLLDNKKLQPTARSVSDYIPRRKLPAHLVHQHAGEIAGEGFRDRITELVKTLVNEYQTTLGEDALSEVQDPNEVSEQQKRFLYHLNRTGAYFRLKERLKGAVVDVVRGAQLQIFLSEAYVFLLDEMHSAINTIFTNPSILTTQPALPYPITPSPDLTTASGRRQAASVALARYADEAERDGDLQAASSYHRERIARDEDDADAWFDYAAFELRTGGKGVETLKEVLSRWPNHVNSLIAHGAMVSAAGEQIEARVCLQAAVEGRPNNILALTTLAMHLNSIGEEEEGARYLAEATKLHQGSAKGGSIYGVVAAFFIHVNAVVLAEVALAQELLVSGPSVHPYLLLSRLEAQRGTPRATSRATENLRTALEIKRDDPNVWAALGHLQYSQEQWEDAQLSYETVLSMPEEPTGLGLVYSRLADLTLRSALPANDKLPGTLAVDVSGARLAKSMYLRACELEPSSRTWIGVGKAAWALDELVEAEDAFSEANVLNNRDPEVWACLSLLCLSLKRSFEAEQCARYALNVGFRRVPLIRKMGKMFLSAHLSSAAAECFRVALEVDPDDKETSQLLMDALGSDSRGFLGSGNIQSRIKNINGVDSSNSSMKGTFGRDVNVGGGGGMQVADAEGAKGGLAV
ncbi:hypothetical protein SmJEL517_g01059 [Synchytrium microbalum]|uniref:C2 domain-containing protein n=1 Tax=Synchytrium microbalum TaxID=1806994 RepID=A0A507C6D6_9FUNG|nr:uncharacterized protein SmJEL517_g01059 [Synchytrium microbalum]TPX37150.1 hypothetical protein SmJEL517_g01059 [Synchytrium microbalum]